MPNNRDYRFDITAPTEDRRREFKRSGPWNQLKFKIARAALAMANTHGGGLIVLGVQDDGQGCTPAGMSGDHMETYNDDEIKTFVNQHADPYVSCSIYRAAIDEKKFIVIDVAEFEEFPVVCKRSCNDEKN
ncbi:MAG: ATP-binding protein, partial [Tepidisphaeraceae bacterium]